jgi:hypothetical protein
VDCGVHNHPPLVHTSSNGGIRPGNARRADKTGQIAFFPFFIAFAVDLFLVQALWMEEPFLPSLPPPKHGRVNSKQFIHKRAGQRGAQGPEYRELFSLASRVGLDR